MSLTRRVAALEARARPPECPRCGEGRCGVAFMRPTPTDYDPGPSGRRPLPPECPACGRRTPKVVVWHDRAAWDGLVREGRESRGEA
ncbi:MAG: hypothetical protein HRU70_10615 [Phycisphaeraceae bacterium]|nr:MAG: hypothetical protein HRU70_10615 [Phycisphaeraceae bacterium]